MTATAVRIISVLARNWVQILKVSPNFPPKKVRKKKVQKTKVQENQKKKTDALKNFRIKKTQIPISVSDLKIS